MASYLEQIAQVRQQRARQEYAETFQQLQNEYRENVQYRDEAACRNDAEDWHAWDRECERIERDLQAFMPVQQPQVDPRALQWDWRNKPYIDRLEQRLGR
jgi:hypothetical protein